MNISILKKEKHYQKLFIAGIVNGVGDRFSSVAVLAMVIQLTGSGVSAGITLAVRMVPFLVFGPIGGKLADHFSRKNILITTDLIRIVFALSFLFVQTKGDLWIVYVSSFVLAAGEAIYTPARKSTIPLLINKKHIVTVNGLEQALSGIVLIGGAISGGLVASVFGSGMTFWLNAASFLGAAVLISTIPFPKRNLVNIANQHQKERVFHIFKKVIKMSAPVQIVFLWDILIATMNGIDNVLISVYAVNEYHLGDMGVGLFYGALGMGVTISSFVSNRLRKHFLMTGLGCLIVEGVFLLFLSRIHFVVLAVFIFFSLAFFSGIGNACFDTILMKEIPAKHQGTMFGLFTTISNPILGLSMMVSGAALEYMKPRTLGFIGGLGYIAIALLLIGAVWRKTDQKAKQESSFF